MGSPPCGYGREKRNAAGPSVSRNISMRTGCAISPWPGNSSVMLYGVGYAIHSVSVEKERLGYENTGVFSAVRGVYGNFSDSSGEQVHVCQHFAHEKRYGRQEHHFHVLEVVLHHGVNNTAGHAEQGNGVEQETAFRRTAGQQGGRRPGAGQALLAAEFRREGHPCLAMFFTDHGVRRNFFGSEQNMKVGQADGADDLVLDAIVI